MSSIQWIEQYSVIPGLANVQERLGFNSSVFVLSAGFLFNSWFGQNLFIINSLCIFIFSTWLLWIAFKKKSAIGLFSLLFLYFFINQYATHISSPGSDVLPNIFMGFILISILLNPEYLKTKYLLFIVLPLFGITLKISIAPVVLLCFYVLYQKDKNIWKLIKKISLFGIALVLPWLVRNIVLSGYLIYPMDEIDLFSVEWKVPREKVIFVKKWIYSWAKDSTNDYSVVLSRSFGEWFPIWWSKMLFINKLLFVSAFSSPFIGTLYVVWNKRNQKYTLLLAFFIGYICLLFWLKAPDFRFSFGVILFLALLPILLLEKVVKKFSKIYNPLLMIGIFICLFFMSKDSYKVYTDESFSEDYSQYIYKPMDPSELKVKKRTRFKKKTYLNTKNENVIFYGFYRDAPCYDQFPCAPRLDNFKMRGENLNDGFIPN